MRYVEPGKAAVELCKRQKNINLVKKVKHLVGEDCPLDIGPYAINAVHIASFGFDDIEFVELAQCLGLVPVVLEYSEDIFVSVNPDKMSYVKLKVFEGFGRKGGAKLKTIRLVKDIRRIERKPFKEIQIDRGENLVEFHHRHRELAGINTPVIEASRWLKKFGRARDYYFYLFVMVSVYGVLFESFESDFYDEGSFKREIVEPAFAKAVKELGVEPLIVKFTPKKEHFNLYPKLD